MIAIPVLLTMALATMVASVGVTAFINPAKAWEFFGMPATTDESIHLAHVFGARALFIGSTFNFLGYKGERKLMGQLCVPWVGMVLLDIWTCYHYGDPVQIWGHIYGCGLTTVLGLWLYLGA